MPGPTSWASKAIPAGGSFSSARRMLMSAAKAVDECGIIQVMTNKFNAENDIGAKVVTQTVDWGTYYDLLSATYSTGNIPDVAVMHGSTLPSFAARDLVEPVGEDLAAAGVDVEDFVPAARAAVTIDGQIDGLPFDIH